ncbi:MAG TPA: N-acetylmuramoyl-L-alanine amidase [Solirubrobacteraceae bacterium]|jgi:hypothetical protein
MSAPALTRRALLGAGAGAVASSLVRPGGALASLLSPQSPELGWQTVGGLSPGGRTIRLDRLADLVAAQWQGPADAGVELRFALPGGGWSRWAAAAGCCAGHEPGAAAAGGAAHIGDPLWTGGTTAVQLRARHALSDVRLALVDVSGGIGARRRAQVAGALSAAALPLATPVLHAGPGQPPIIARQAWARGISPPRVAPGYGDVRLAFVHHTENPNGYSPAEVPAMLRAIYAYHRFVHGWNDIGYNFVVDLYGRIFEARAGGIDEPVVGAQAGGYNLVSTGVAVLGSFMSAPVSAAARASLERLLAWKLSLHGVPAAGRVTVRVNPAGASYSRFPADARVSLRRIAGHRDGDSTDCPGDALYGELPALRSAVGRLAPRPVLATLSLAPAAPAPAPTPATPAPGATPPAPGSPPAVAPGSPPGEARTLTGSLSVLGGGPVAGARVLVQARTVARKGEVVRELSVGEAVTDPAGHWTLAAILGPGRRRTSLRALFPGAGGLGAAVSAPLALAGALAVSPPPAGPPGAPSPSPPAAAPPST